MSPTMQPVSHRLTNSSSGASQIDSMTKKIIRPSTWNHDYQIPLRQAGAHNEVCELPSASYNDTLDEKPPKNAPSPERHFHVTPRLSVSSNSYIKPNDSNTGRSTSPSLHSHADALSPNSTTVYTPSESNFAASSYSPASTTSRKRRFSEEDRTSRKFSIAGLLNPASQQSTPRHSPPCDGNARSESLSAIIDPARMRDDDTYSLYSPPAPRPAAGSRFTWIEPRPKGFNDRQLPEETVVDSTETQAPPRKKGRTGAFKTDEERKAIFAVREMGACLRCQIMRIKCDPVKEEACSNCRETSAKSRKWTLPCTRKLLNKRWEFFFPDFLREHHNTEKTFPNIDQDLLCEPFEIKLIHPAEFSFNFPVCEVIDLTKAGLDASYFDKYDYSHYGDPLHPEVKMAKSSSLPIIPGDRRWREHTDYAVRHMNQLMNLKRTQKWQSDALPADKGQPWARKVLLMVIHFHGETNNSEALKQALKCCEIRCLLNHPFGIDPNYMEDFNLRLSDSARITWQDIQRKKSDSELWSPKMVNRWLKSTLQLMLFAELPKLFEELENSFKLLDNRGDEAKLSELDRDEIFCTIVACFVFIGSAQRKLLQAARAWEKDADYKTNKMFKGEHGAMVAEAKRYIKEIETEVVDHILQLYKYRFNRQTMKGHVHAGQEEAAKKAQNFGGYGVNVIQEFQRLMRVADFQEALSDVRLTLDVDSEEGEHQLQTNNVTRLLLKLNREIWRPRSQRNRMRNQL